MALIDLLCLTPDDLLVNGEPLRVERVKSDIPGEGIPDKDYICR